MTGMAMLYAALCMEKFRNSLSADGSMDVDRVLEEVLLAFDETGTTDEVMSELETIDIDVDELFRLSYG